MVDEHCQKERNYQRDWLQFTMFESLKSCKENISDTNIMNIDLHRIFVRSIIGPENYLAAIR